jgi:hypothetical protein
MKKVFLDFYNTLDKLEKRNFWLGSFTFIIGLVFLIEVLIPASWRGWQETRGEITAAQNVSKGLFSGGTMLFSLRYIPQDGSAREGTFTMSPIILSTMKQIRVFYQKDNPTVFYVYNPTRLTLSLLATVLGGGLLLAYFLYYRDRLNGIMYD